MVCKACGKALENPGGICPFCGAALETQTPELTEEQKADDGAKYSGLHFYLLSAALLLTGILIGFLFLPLLGVAILLAACILALLPVFRFRKAFRKDNARLRTTDHSAYLRRKKEAEQEIHKNKFLRLLPKLLAAVELILAVIVFSVFLELSNNNLKVRTFRNTDEMLNETSGVYYVSEDFYFAGEHFPAGYLFVSKDGLTGINDSAFFNRDNFTAMAYNSSNLENIGFQAYYDRYNNLLEIITVEQTELTLVPKRGYFQSGDNSDVLLVGADNCLHKGFIRGLKVRSFHEPMTKDSDAMSVSEFLEERFNSNKESAITVANKPALKSKEAYFEYLLSVFPEEIDYWRRTGLGGRIEYLGESILFEFDGIRVLYDDDSVMVTGESEKYYYTLPVEIALGFFARNGLSQDEMLQKASHGDRNSAGLLGFSEEIDGIRYQCFLPGYNIKVGERQGWVIMINKA